MFGVIGFGLGGITFRNHHKNETNEEAGKQIKEAENELRQHKENKIIYENKALELIKENTEINKVYNRSQRTNELLQKQLLELTMLLEQKPQKVEKAEKNIDSYFN